MRSGRRSRRWGLRKSKSGTRSTDERAHQFSFPSDATNYTYDDPHIEVSPAIGVQGPRTVGLITRNADVVESLSKADSGPVGTLWLELQGHEATEAVQEGSRGARSVVGRGTTKATRSPAGSGVAAVVSRVVVVIIVDD